LSSVGRPERPAELLRAVGLSSEALTHYPFQFSGGQRQRVAIARALAMEPQLLIADEPLSALDVTTQAQILDLFKKLKVSHGLTLLFITHDLAVAHAFADRVIVLKEGQIVEAGLANAVFTSPQHPYTRALWEAIPKIPC
jgi:ABC-type oligopeptide transport system ATPase subunit